MGTQRTREPSVGAYRPAYLSGLCMRTTPVSLPHFDSEDTQRHTHVIMNATLWQTPTPPLPNNNQTTTNVGTKANGKYRVLTSGTTRARASAITPSLTRFNAGLGRGASEARLSICS